MANQLKVAIVTSILTLHKRGWSQRKIARELGVSRTTVRRHLAGNGSDPNCTTNPPPGSGAGPASSCEPFGQIIEVKLAGGLSGARIWQDLVAEHGFANKYHSVRRFVRALGQTSPLPMRRMECLLGEQAQVDLGTGAPIIRADGRRREPVDDAGRDDGESVEGGRRSPDGRVRRVGDHSGGGAGQGVPQQRYVPGLGRSGDSRVRVGTPTGPAKVRRQEGRAGRGVREPPADSRPGGKRALRKRGELPERSFAHCYETGGMRRMHLRGHRNILKRLVLHVAGFNLSLVMRRMFGIGKPRCVPDGLERQLAGVFSRLRPRWHCLTGRWRPQIVFCGPMARIGRQSRLHCAA